MFLQGFLGKYPQNIWPFAETALSQRLIVQRLHDLRRDSVLVFARKTLEAPNRVLQ